MDAERTETLYLEDRTDWSPQPRWGADRRGVLLVLAVLAAFGALASARPGRSARPRAEVARRGYYVVALAGGGSGCSPRPRW